MCNNFGQYVIFFGKNLPHRSSLEEEFPIVPGMISTGVDFTAGSLGMKSSGDEKANVSPGIKSSIDEKYLINDRIVIFKQKLSSKHNVGKRNI